MPSLTARIRLIAAPPPKASGGQALPATYPFTASIRTPRRGRTPPSRARVTRAGGWVGPAELSLEPGPEERCEDQRTPK